MGWSMQNESDEVSGRKIFTQTSHPKTFTGNFSERWENVPESEINLIVNQVLSLNGSSLGDPDSIPLQNLKTSLSDWQIAELENVRESESGIRCLLNSWLVIQKNLTEGTYCNATWDNVYCWPPTPLGSTLNRTCLDAFKETEPLYAPHLQGHGYRVCQANGLWLWGKWTNYTECADSYDALVDTVEKYVLAVGESKLVTTVQYILCIGSILSLICLLSAVTIFYYFRVLRCDRVTIHIHLMVALILRYIMLFVITGPVVFKRSSLYRNVDMVCKGVLIVYLYATLASINWMFIQGIYINGKLTTNVFHGRTPFKVYYTIGWLLPFVLMTIWSIIMHFNHDVHCWSGYSEMIEIWIIICPIILALVVRWAAKATICLFPLLGINNLLFLYNPGGDLYKYFVILNSLFGSAQGIIVAIVYCYLSNDVREAFVRVYRRFMARRSADLIRRRPNPRNAAYSATLGLIVQHPVSNQDNEPPALLVIRDSQHSPTSCSASYKSSQNNSRGDSSGYRPCQISNSSSQNTIYRYMLQTSCAANIPVSPSRLSSMSAASQSSFTMCANVNSNIVEYSRVHNSYRNIGGGCLLASTEDSLSSCDGAVVTETYGQGDVLLHL